MQESSIRFANNKTNKTWSVSATPLELSGTLGEIHGQANVDWPQRGSVLLDVKIDQMPGFDLLEKQGLRELHIGTFRTSAGWTNGPVGLLD